MHRSAFRTKKPAMRGGQPEKAAPTTASNDLDDIRSQIAELSKDIRPLRASMESLAAPSDDISVPSDIDKSLKSLHSRLDKIEGSIEELEAQQRRMSTTFSNAILKLADKVEKISGGEDSSFSLAHSLEKLIKVLESRKIRIIRDKDGDMTGLETM